MDPTIVIKVTHGETLRRFSSCVVDGKLGLDMNALREKVCYLFNFPAGSELAFTYIDEDGDVVTLADEKDLCDIASQFLDPLRITVKLNMERSVRSHSRSSENFTPVGSRGIQPPLQVKSTSVSGVMNSLPDAVRETVSRLSTELGFDANSPTGYIDLLDSLAKMGLTYLKEVSVSGAKSRPSESSTDAPVTKDKSSSIAARTTPVLEMKSSDTDHGNGTGFLEGFVMPATDNANGWNKPSSSPANADGRGKADGQGKADIWGVKADGWDKPSSSPANADGWGNADGQGKADVWGVKAGWDKPSSSPANADGQGKADVWGDKAGVWDEPSTFLAKTAPNSSNVTGGHKEMKSSDTDQGNGSGFSKGFVMPATYKANGWNKPSSSLANANGWDKPSTFIANTAPNKFYVTGGHKEMKSSDTDQENGAGFSEGFVMPATNNANAWDKPSTFLANAAPNSFNVTGGHKQDEDNKFRGYYSKRNIDIGSSEGNKVGNNGRFGKEVKKFSESRPGWKSVMGRSIRIDSPPFSGPHSYVHSRQYPPCVVPFKKSYNNSGAVGSVFHKGVKCDGCGVHPIVGPRFKSKVKEDYDLCSICFASMGSEAKYIRMDHPMCFQDPHCMGRSPTLPADHSKLDSCFIQDVNIPDGTIMTPSTLFTKVWRMRNSGAVDWPHGTQLVWIGGLKFSNILSCDLKIPAEGCPVGKEIDIAVDFTSPKHPGRHISYWRMASPSGLKFGQRLWVSVQVDSSLKGSLVKNGHDFNLNLPPVSSGIMDFQNENACIDPIIGDGPSEIVKYNEELELLEPVVETPERDQRPDLPIYETLLVAGPEPISASLEASTPVTYPAVELSKAEPVAMSVPQYSNMDVQGEDEVEQTLLKDLEEMGFTQVDLNKEILRKNEYDLEQSINDLCGVTEWDPILAELQEMGFSNNEMNRMLLEKNNGSIKRVVMDLISGEDA